jgi:hypothetical protein
MAVGTYLKAALSISIFLAAVSGAAASAPTQAQPEFPADGDVITGETVRYLGYDYIWTKLIFIPGATAVEHTGYFSDDYSKVESRDPCAFLGHPPYGSIPGWEYTFFAGNPQVPPANDTLIRSTKYYWTVDAIDVEGNTFAGEICEFAVQGWKAFEPSPPNEAVDVETIVQLCWLLGFNAQGRDVYIGTSWEDVNNARYNYYNQPPEFLGTITEPNVLVTDLAHGVTYYWRVDELSGGRCVPPLLCVGIPYKGDVWSFTTVGDEAQPDFPADGEVIVGDEVTYLGDKYIWTKLIFLPGSTAVEHTGYFSDDYSKVESRAEDANLGSPPYASIPGWEYTFFAGNPQVPPANQTLVRDRTYYWTVDAIDALGHTFAGEIWEFTILGFYASEPDPPNEAVDVETTVLLSWRSGFLGIGHAVFLGTSWDDVNDAVYNRINQPPEFLAVTTEPNILVTGLDFNTKYYWRVDECAGGCMPPSNCCIFYKGDVWSFTTEANRIFVDVDATGANNGTSWADAYNYLQDSLADANSSAKPVEIWVAEGIYTPDSNSADPNGSGSREATFQLVNGVTIKGGYAGFGEANPNARDIELYESILSGDLDGNDVDVNDPADLLDESTRNDNSYHVVIGSGTDANAVLDGFTISGGNAEGANYGGGVYNNNGSPTISNCVFSENSAGREGGGMFNNSESHPTVTNCTFTLNAAGSGGGMRNRDFGKPTLTNCIFIRNLSLGYAGGGIYGGYGQIISCTFTGNSAQNYGGGLADCGGLISDCTISGNSAGITGGGFDYAEANPGTLINCIISDNTSGDDGGGIYFRPPTIPPPLGALGDPSYSSLSLPKIVITNCTVSGNVTGGDGGGLYSRVGISQLTNCIFWGNTPDQIYGGTSVTYSDVQGGEFGTGNINADPCFVDEAGGDLRLSWDSPCIDAGYNNAPNLPATDMDGHPRIIDGDCNDTEVVDMGAFEFNYAYMGDFDYNCRVNFADLSIFGSAWTSQPGDFNWDFACNINIPADNVIDRLDLAAFADNWLAGF